MTAAWLNAAMILLATVGFLALALASNKPGAALVGRKITAREQTGLRIAAWPLLVLALVCGVIGWGNSVGWTTWFGWLTVAGVGLVFAFPAWERARAKPDPAARPRKEAPPVPLSPPLQFRPARLGAAALLIGAPVAFLAVAAFWPAQPVLRDDAIHGQVGPWSFTIAEYNQRKPSVVVKDFPAKSFQIRFCDTCDDEIRAAYLKVNKPRSLRGAGLVFSPDRWNRFVEIHLPGSTRPDTEIWLTVEGKDGSLHYASWPVGQISPTTATWLQARRQPE